MMLRVAIAFLALCLATFTGARADPVKDQAEIRKLWADLAKCEENKDGDRVASFYSKATVEFYDRLVKVAVKGSAAEVKALPPIERHEVLKMRLLGTRAELEKLDGRGYMRLATSKGWNSSGSEKRKKETLDKFEFSANGTKAKARIVREGAAAGPMGTFVKEGGKWRFDEAAMVPLVNAVISARAKQVKKSENEIIFERLKETTGKTEIPESIWEPMK